jgi:hypothetical protein
VPGGEAVEEDTSRGTHPLSRNMPSLNRFRQYGQEESWSCKDQFRTDG